MDNGGEDDDGNDVRVNDNGADKIMAEPVANDHNERIFRRLMPNYQQKEPMSCELCGEMFSMPVSYHMLTTHPGCGHSSGGYGYTSNGIYKTGWSGACGEGGIAWYLLCESCRGDYMKRSKLDGIGSDPTRSRKTATIVRRTYTTGAAAGGDDDNRKPHGKLTLIE